MMSWTTLWVLSSACLLPCVGAGQGQPVSPPAGAPKLAWVRFQDPLERAFTVDVPQGWTVKGGLFRLGYSDQRPMVDLTSPDGRTNIRVGDVSVPLYTVPSQYHAREGEAYDLGAQAQMIVARYRNGPEYVVLYSQARFARTCQNAQSDTGVSEFTVPEYLPIDTPPKQSSAGQVAYFCETSGGQRIAFAYTKTALFGDLWGATAIASFLAPREQASLAERILRHMAESFRVDSQWLEYQKRMDAEGLEYQRMRQRQRLQELQSQVRQFEAKMRALQSQVNVFERRQAQSAAQVESFTNAVIGVTPTTDPLTGENRTVWTGPKTNYWANGLGQVVNATNAPAPGWRQLETR
jgi:hypothetical protein